MSLISSDAERRLARTVGKEHIRSAKGLISSDAERRLALWHGQPSTTHQRSY